MPKTRRLNGARGVALVEVMAAVTILLITLMGSGYLYISGSRFLANQQRTQLALQLAAQKLEDIRGEAYLDISLEEEYYNDSEAYDSTSYTREVVVTDPNGTYKEIEVTVNWSDGSGAGNHELVLGTYIAP